MPVDQHPAAIVPGVPLGEKLFLASASVELSVSVSASASGGVKVWVVNADAGGSRERSGKVTVQLNTGNEALGVGM